MPSSLPRSTPAAQGVDSAAVHSFLDALDERPDIEMHSLMVVRHGQVVAEGWWAPYSAERPQLLYSLSKSFTSTAAAFAQAEGLLDLDDEIVAFKLRQRVPADLAGNENLSALRNDAVGVALWRSPVLRLHNFKRAFAHDTCSRNLNR